MHIWTNRQKHVTFSDRGGGDCEYLDGQISQLVYVYSDVGRTKDMSHECVYKHKGI